MEIFRNISVPTFQGRSSKLFLLLGLGVAGVTLSLKYLRKREIVYEKCGKVLKLIIYPIKSLPGIEVDEIEITPRGAKVGTLEDRCFVLVDENNRFITIRHEPSLVKLSVSFNHDENCIVVRSPDGDHVKISVEDRKNPVDKDEIIDMRYLKYDVQGVDWGEEYAQFFRNYLKRDDVKLVRYLSNLLPRPARLFRRGRWIIDKGANIAYHDESPCHIVNENSVAQLNKWMEDFVVDYKYFRPTVYVEAPAFSEDLWEFMKIGDLEFNFLSKNPRCKVSQTDPVTAEVHDKPMETLRKYRSVPKNEKKLGSGPLLGTHVRPVIDGKIKVGQEIYACNFL